MSLMATIQNNTQAKVPEAELFQSWVDMTANCLPEKMNSHFTELCIRIVDKKESAYLNETYRHKKGPTNVLSFSIPTQVGLFSESLGDLAICAELVAEEAILQDKSILAHWAHLTVHGMLHLLGYDHQTTHDADIMATLEIQILEKLGFPNPYQENDQERIIDA